MTDQETQPTPRDRALSPTPTKTLRWVVTFLCIAALTAFLPLWGSLAFATWIAGMMRPLLERFASGKKKSRRRVAGVLSTALVLLIVLPLSLLILSLSLSAADLAQNLLKSDDGPGAMKTLLSGEAEDGEDRGGLDDVAKRLAGRGDGGTGAVSDGGLGAGDAGVREGAGEGDSGGHRAGNEPSKKTATATGGGPFSLSKVMPMLESHGKELFSALNTIAGAFINIALMMVVFVLATYTFLVDGPAIYGWLRQRSPILPKHTDRLSAAFMESGRGLIIGTGLTALVPGTAAGIGYAIGGIPSAFVLGFATGIMSLVPAIGTALVWGPIAITLFAMDESGKAIGIAVVGLLVSSADNFLHPFFSRYGKLQLPTFVLFVTMVGGIMIFGGAGIVLGPLFTRLAVEGLEILREQRLGLPRQPATPTDSNDGM